MADANNINAAGDVAQEPAAGQVLWKEGYPDDCFQDASIANELLCSICALVARHPMQCDRCSQMYCSMCLRRWMLQHEGNTCPTCRGVLIVTELVRDVAKQNRIEEATSACRQCEWTGVFGVDGLGWVSHVLEAHAKDAAADENALFEWLPARDVDAERNAIANVVAALGADNDVDPERAIQRIATEYMMNYVRERLPTFSDILTRPDAVELLLECLFNVWLSDYCELLETLSTVPTQKPFFHDILAPLKYGDVPVEQQWVLMQEFVKMLQPHTIAMEHRDTAAFVSSNSGVAWFAPANFESDAEPERDLFACSIEELWEELQEKERNVFWEACNGLWALGHILSTISGHTLQLFLNTYLKWTLQLRRDSNIMMLVQNMPDDMLSISQAMYPQRKAICRYFVCVIGPRMRRQVIKSDFQAKLDGIYPLIPRKVIETIIPQCPPAVRPLLQDRRRLDVIEVITAIESTLQG